MFFSLSSIRKPKQEFNLLHLETQEYYFLSLKVSLHNNNEIRGKLHICSRSLVFQPNQPKLPMIKMKYSNNLILKILRNIDTKTMNQIMSIKWTPSLLMEDIDSLDINQLYQHFKRDKNNELLDRLYKVQSRTANSQYTIMFLRVDKLFVINRNPISPYITETCDENIVFSISQSNSKQNIVRFLKLYQGLTQAEDENSFISTIINTTLNEAMNEHRAYSSQQGLKIELAVKCKLIRPEGNIYGLFSIQRDEGIKYIPLINSPKGKILMWQLTDIKFFLKYRYMFKQIGLEIWFFNKKRSVLLAFEDPQQLDTVYKYLIRKTTKNQISSITVEKLTELWVDGSLSNFDYLMSLNTFSSRSFCDLSAYPVFPWVIAEYTDKTFDLTSPEFFRDLSRPVGALNKHRLQKYKQSYQEQLKSLKNNNNNDIIPYIYPTHYSSPGTVVYYLIRKIPEFVIKLQNGVFGPTDRIFRGIDSTWYTTLNLHADSKELIPEFYSLDPDFLINCDKLELGMTQEGEIIDDAIIPPWANSMTDFLLKMRMALESDYVSSQLPKWIDLIFGCKTRGDEAVKQDNLFYPYTYAENVNWNQCRTSIEKQALETQVAEFGQVPIQLFNSSHPNRKLKIHPSLKQKQQQQLNSSSQRNLQLTDIQQESQNKDYVTCLQNQVSSLQWENEKLKFNLDTIKQELQLQKIETFNSQYDQEEIDKKGQDLMSDDTVQNYYFSILNLITIKKIIKYNQIRTYRIQPQFISTNQDVIIIILQLQQLMFTFYYNFSDKFDNKCFQSILPNQPPYSRRLESDFKVLGRIGKGGFSKVYKVTNLLDKNTYALKKIELKSKDIKDSLEKNIERAQREAKYLARLSHPKIIRYFNSWVEVMQNKSESKLIRKQEQDQNDYVVERNNFSFCDSQSNSKNDLENLIMFKDAQNEQISYSEQENDIQPKSRVSRQKQSHNTQNKKSTSQDEKKLEFDKIIFYIQTEFCQETLENYLQKRNNELLRLKKKNIEKYQLKLQNYEKEAKLILEQIIKGLDYLHNECNLVHRDLKPGNIFMNSPEDVKIGDFGLVTKLKQFYDFDDQDNDDDICTKMYAAPEQINQNRNKSFYDQKSDIYALGLIILLLFHPISTSMEMIKVINDARKGVLPSILRDKHGKIAEIILECLNNDPKKRPNINEITFQDSSNSLSSSKKSSNEFSSDTTDYFIKNIGICQVKFEDEDAQEKYLIFNSRQIQIFKNQKSLKAQMIYNLSECNISYIDDRIVIQHSQLENFSFTTTHSQLQDIYDQLCELTQSFN